MRRLEDQKPLVADNGGVRAIRRTGAPAEG